MRSILLVRHGPVAVKAPGLLSFEAFCAHVAAYERSGLEPEAQPPARLAQLMCTATAVFASDAPRVADTLARLDLSPDVIETDFREAPPEAPRLPLRLPELGWLALARARGAFDPALAEARRDLHRRAARCAEQLIAAAADSPAALVGHGWFNAAVGRALVVRNWRKIEGPGFGRPWGHVIYAPAK